MADSRLQSPLGRVMGLGSAKEGVAHWWAQRLTAIALVPLLIWFVIEIISLTGAPRAEVVAWLHSPFAAIVTVLMLIAVFYHMALGVQIVIEDYIHSEWSKVTLLVINKFLAFALAAAGIFAVLRIAFQG
ncbi:MAG TPA: succinate dehydrogenase, hydrophobic membrane anchor protein [Stellaceae bacterium]|jgi:succinate dehydrogenase / fumarate reductase membrane anchor subunit|nr:succinate dehydrogenase, hydrophobic membrane anchor protein [Stellaceae bacterium]